MRIVCISIFLFILTACGLTNGTQVENWNFQGIVAAKEEGRVLVIDEIREDLLPISIDELLEKEYPAAWFEVDNTFYEEVEVGNRVKVLYEVMLESYPGQAEAKRITIIEEN